MNKLAIDVWLKPNGDGIKDGMTFTYSYTDGGLGSKYYLRDETGNIDVPLADAAALDITFKLGTTSVLIAGDRFDISFRLGDSASRPLRIESATRTAPPADIFTQPTVAPNNTQVTTTTSRRDRKVYKYTLQVGARNVGSGEIHRVKHDPRIRNGGNTDPFTSPGNGGTDGP